jgi:AcrR family transcriptional regulator
VPDPDAGGAGAAVRRTRLSRGLSLRTVAARTGVSPATLSAVENGRTGLTVSRLHELAAVLGVPAAELLGTAVPVHPVVPVVPALPPADGTQWRAFGPLGLDPVLAAAIDAFVETGYHGASVRDIARRAGMSVPGLYHHYPSKQDLLVTVLDLTMAELRHRVALARAEGTSAPERFALVVEALALFHTHRRELAFIGASEMRSLAPRNRRRIADLRDDVQHVLDEEVRAAVAEGSFTTPHPHDAARAVSTMCTSLPQWFSADGPSTPEQIATEYARFALSLMGHRGTP